MFWSKVYFGKHEGKTLPQILCSDPDWFFWAMENNVFKNKGVLLSEAKDLYKKARSIKIPDNDNKELEVEYVFHQPTGKFSHFDIVPKGMPAHDGSSQTLRLKLIDMSVPRQIAAYDKLGCKHLLLSLKFHLFESKSARLTKKRCEEFFSDESNFA